MKGKALQTAKAGKTTTNVNTPYFQKKGEKNHDASYFQLPVQTKLRVGSPDSPYEKEADAIGEQVSKKEAPGSSDRPLISSVTPLVQSMPDHQEEVMEREESSDSMTSTVLSRKEEEETVLPKREEEQQVQQKEEEQIQQKSFLSVKTPGLEKGKQIQQQIKKTRGQGNPLPREVRARMDTIFGADFGEVNIHVDSTAEILNAELHAQAFTIGKDIYFNQGKFDPNSEEGLFLLGHELTHIIQQGEVKRITTEPDQVADSLDAGLLDAAGEVIDVSTTVEDVSIEDNISDSTETETSPIDAEATPSAEGVEILPLGAEQTSEEGTEGKGPLLSREPLMPPPPEELGEDAKKRLSSAQSSARSTARNNKKLPSAQENTTASREGVTEPKEEANARASAELTAVLEQKPQPSPEIVELCEKIRQVIRDKRPPDEDSLLEADPEEAAKEAGDALNKTITSDTDRVGGEYAEMENTPEGDPSQIGQTPATPAAGVGAPAINASQSAPDPIPGEDLSLDNDVENTRAAMDGAGMTTEVADVVQDGPIAEARKTHGELEEKAKVDPEKVKTDQELKIAAAQGDMHALQAQALEALQSSRSGSIKGAGGQQLQMVGTETQKRESIGRKANGIFTTAQDSVRNLLSPLTGKAMEMWKTAKTRLSTEFRNHLDKVQDWVDERHSGVGGFFLGIADYVSGLPDWVTDEYNEAEKTFGDGVCDKILEISTYVNSIILSCEQIIANANKDIDQLFETHKDELGSWADEEKLKFQQRLDGLHNEVLETQENFNKELAQEASQTVQEVREEVHTLREAAKGLIGRIADFIQEFIDDPVRAIINGLLRLVGIAPARFWALAAKISQVISDIADDPVGFGENLLNAVGKGFDLFFDNFGFHLLDAFVQWLLSGLGKMGITVPAEFSLPSVITFFLQIMGITWDRIKKLLAKHIGEENVELIEQAFEMVATLIEMGPKGIFEWMKEMLNPKTILDMIIDIAIDFMVDMIVKASAEKILTLFIPGGAILVAIEAIYKVLKWIFENAARIFTLIESVVNGIADVIAGNIDAMAKTVELALKKLMIPVIDFVAGFLGLGDLPDKVAGAVKDLQEWVEVQLDKGITFLADQAKALLKTLGFGKDEEKGDDQNDASLGDSEVGRKMTFIADEESHSLWIDTSGSGVEIMIRSTPMTVGAKLDQWENKLSELEEENQAEAKSLISTARQQYATTKQEGAEAEDEIADAKKDPTPTEVDQAKQADDEAESAQSSLKSTLQKLFEVFGEDDMSTMLAFLEKVDSNVLDTIKDIIKNNEDLKKNDNDEEIKQFLLSQGEFKGIVDTPLNISHPFGQYNSEHLAKPALMDAILEIGLKIENPDKYLQYRKQFINKGQSTFANSKAQLAKQVFLKSNSANSKAALVQDFKARLSGDKFAHLDREDIRTELEKAASSAPEGWTGVFATGGTRLMSKTPDGGESFQLTLAKVWEENGTSRSDVVRTVLNAVFKTMNENINTTFVKKYITMIEEDQLTKNLTKQLLERYEGQMPPEAAQIIVNQLRRDWISSNALPIAETLVRNMEGKELYFVKQTEIPRNLTSGPHLIKNPATKSLTDSKYNTIAKKSDIKALSELNGQIHHVISLYLGGGSEFTNLMVAEGNARGKDGVEESAHEAMHKFIDHQRITLALENGIQQATLDWSSLNGVLPAEMLKIIIGTVMEDGSISYGETDLAYIVESDTKSINAT